MNKRLSIATELKGALEAHPFHDMTTLGKAVGKSRGYMSSFFAGRGNPDFMTFHSICTELSVDPLKLINGGSSFRLSSANPMAQEVEKQAAKLLNRVTDAVSLRMAMDNRDFSMDDLIVWWKQNNGRLCGMDAFMEHVDLIHAPSSDDTLIKPYRMGAKSLASEALFSNDPSRLQRFLESITDKEREEITWSYVQAAMGPSTAVPSVVVDLDDMDEPNHLDYYRLLLPVYDAKGNEYILNYSRKIG